MTEALNGFGRLVPVGRFLNPVQAQMAKGMLESTGIECFLQGEHANHMVPLAFRVRLLVLEEDEAAARELLDAVDNAAAGEDRRQVGEL